MNTIKPNAVVEGSKGRRWLFAPSFPAMGMAPPEDSASTAKPIFLLLDIDGTLVMTDHLYLLVFQDLMATYGYTNVDEAWFAKNVAGKVDEEVFAALLPAGSTPEQVREASLRKDALFCEKVETLGATIVKGLGSALQMARAS